MIKLFRNKKNKAIAFVDYEYWFYSCKERFNLYPNLQRWKDEITKRFELKDIMVFGDFSHENIAGDLHKVRSITNTVIETSNTFMRKKKDMTDFITLVCKRYGRRVNIIAYIDFDDGRKVVCSAYSSKNYLGLKNIEMGSRVEVSFAPNTNGKVQLTAIAVIE